MSDLPPVPAAGEATTDADKEHCGGNCTGGIDESGQWNPDEADGMCVHCECCCSCLGCEYGPRDGMLMFPAPVSGGTAEASDDAQVEVSIDDVTEADLAVVAAVDHYQGGEDMSQPLPSDAQDGHSGTDEDVYEVAAAAHYADIVEPPYVGIGVSRAALAREPRFRAAIDAALVYERTQTTDRAKRVSKALDYALLLIASLPDTCRYHGADHGFLGWQYGEPRCDSCKQPHRVRRARELIEDVDDAI